MSQIVATLAWAQNVECAHFVEDFGHSSSGSCLDVRTTLGGFKKRRRESCVKKNREMFSGAGISNVYAGDISEPLVCQEDRTILLHHHWFQSLDHL
jgi:hypothetical protein